ncbi:hypothetical protein NA57DRAFT_42567 [Rhizodiscina lignyota]|uniref:Calponin-homology (CH) domain-containing protein n=1 Tax=Rhizodiscina lignyota TaxID=1504668 RepID=A0A9P4M6I3_9PEZI|nr:hypothetical protein NA57DRAFT_42567 [Rhizodiscina lignyota]
MRRYSQATPCPGGDNIPNSSFPRRARVSFANDPRTYGGYAENLPDLTEDTENVEFTTEWRTQLRHAKPRRRPTAMMARPSFNPSLDIWDDIGRDQDNQRRHEQVQARGPIITNEGRAKRSSMLERPAMRMPIAPAARGYAEPVPREQLPPQPRRQRRISTLAEEGTDATTSTNPFLAHHNRRVNAEVLREQLRNGPRRGTMFIPSEDTTFVNIFPGRSQHQPRDTRRRRNSPDIGLELVTMSDEENASPQHQVMRPENRAPRMSLAAKPKRAPLQPSSRGAANVMNVEDVLGQGGGKENIPPGKVLHLDLKAGPADIVIHFDDAKGKKSQQTTLNQLNVTSSSAPLSSTAATSYAKKSDSTSSSKKRFASENLSPVSPAKAVKGDHSATKSKSALSKSKASITSSVSSKQREPPTKRQGLREFRPDPSAWAAIQSSQIEKRTIRQVQHPLITDDLAHPELYEDHWLEHQEIALSQLLNHLLEKSTSHNVVPSESDTSLRRGVLAIYHADDVVQLYKRMQISLLWGMGALAIPKEMVDKASRIKVDTGLKRKFIDLWLDCYDHTALKAALEAVVGREVTMPMRLSETSEQAPESERQSKIMRRALEQYIDKFILRHEDATKSKSDVGSIANIARNIENHQINGGPQAEAWRKTMTRSLMLILLLDKGKSSNIIPGCLFQASSLHKSSVSILQAVASMLFPSVGDVTRSLGHINYRVGHVQRPLEEYKYAVSNIAADLRDGVLLARVVELSLFTHAKLSSIQDNTVTVTLPSGEMLNSNLNGLEEDSWVLSQHLKLPCISRTQKLYNVQVSLSALKGLKGLPSRIAESVTAEDIVDGHREKTLGLLWSLVGKCGLEVLLDWSVLKRELVRLQEKSSIDDDWSDIMDFDDDDDDPDRFTKMLHTWARSVGKLHGVDIRNLTTAFADGRAFEAIVDEYIQFVPQAEVLKYSSSRRATLSSKLRSIGCSASFLSLFTPSSPTAVSVPSKSFTITTLAYLASRLLPQTITYRAAVTIQRWYKKALARRSVRKRLQLMRLAADCATVVNTRVRVVGAAVVLQRAWRAVLEARVTQLVGDVVKLQALIKGWGVRSAVYKTAGQKKKGGW